MRNISTLEHCVSGGDYRDREWKTMKMPEHKMRMFTIEALLSWGPE